MVLVTVPLHPTAAFKRVRDLSKGEAATGELVRQALLNETLLQFDLPQVSVVGETPLR